MQDGQFNHVNIKLFICFGPKNMTEKEEDEQEKGKKEKKVEQKEKEKKGKGKKMQEVKGGLEEVKEIENREQGKYEETNQEMAVNSADFKYR